MEELLEMSSKELDRYRILCEVKDKRISQQRGAELLGLSTRQIRNLLCDLKVEGSMDSSHHDWLEGRSPPCVLIVLIDDATSSITSL